MVKAETIVPHKPFRFSDVQLAQLRSVLEDSPGTRRFVSDAQRIVDDYVATKRKSNSFRTLESVRIDIRAIQKGARALATQICELQVEEKEILGQLLWVADKRYYPAAFSVETLAEGLRVLELAATRMARRDQGGRSQVQLDVLIRDVNSAYVTRFNHDPKATAAKANAFLAAIKVCLKAAGERPPANLRAAVKQALNP